LLRSWDAGNKPKPNPGGTGGATGASLNAFGGLSSFRRGGREYDNDRLFSKSSITSPFNDDERSHYSDSASISADHGGSRARKTGNMITKVSY
jgi:hypothetical protein